MQIKDLMRTNPFCIEPDASALDALDLMLDEGIHHLPVVDSRRYVVGVISIGDLAAALPSEISGRRPAESPDDSEMSWTRVGDVMSYGPETLTSSTPAREAAQSMVSNGIGCLPIVDADGRLEGIVSEADLVRAYAASGTDSEIMSPTEAASRDERLVETLREEAERLGRSLSVAEPGDSKLAATRLQSLEEAIARAERGELLSCTRCEGTISASRLRALPGTTICSRCAREIEW